MITTPPEKIPNTSESISTPPKNLNPSRKNLNLPEKLLLPKNSITIIETISNTRTKSQPLPEKSQPLVKNSQSLLKNLNPLPSKIFSTLLDNVLTLPENFTCNHPENLTKPLNNSQPPEYFLTSLKISHTP